MEAQTNDAPPQLPPEIFSLIIDEIPDRTTLQNLARANHALRRLCRPALWTNFISLDALALRVMSPRIVPRARGLHFALFGEWSTIRVPADMLDQAADFCAQLVRPSLRCVELVASDTSTRGACDWAKTLSPRLTAALELLARAPNLTCLRLVGISSLPVDVLLLQQRLQCITELELSELELSPAPPSAAADAPADAQRSRITTLHLGQRSSAALNVLRGAPHSPYPNTAVFDFSGVRHLSCEWATEGDTTESLDIVDSAVGIEVFDLKVSDEVEDYSFEFADALLHGSHQTIHTMKLSAKVNLDDYYLLPFSSLVCEFRDLADDGMKNLTILSITITVQPTRMFGISEICPALKRKWRSLDKLLADRVSFPKLKFVFIDVNVDLCPLGDWSDSEDSDDDKDSQTGEVPLKGFALAKSILQEPHFPLLRALQPELFLIVLHTLSKNGQEVY